MSKLADFRHLSEETAQHFGIVEERTGWEYPSPSPLFRRWKAYPHYTGAKYIWKPGGAPAMDMVYNLKAAEGEGAIYVVEGEPDVWTMHEAGLPAVSFMAGAATMPSATAISQLHSAMQAPYRVWIIYDRDKEGEAGAQQLRGLLMEHGFEARLLLVPEEAGEHGDVSALWILYRSQERFVETVVSGLEEWEPPQPGSFAVPVTAWLEERAPELEWIVDGLLPARSVALVAGFWSSGKSWFVADLGISVATGKAFLGHFETAAGATIIADQDSHEDDQRRRYRNLFSGYRLNGDSLGGLRVAFYRDIDLLNPEWQGLIMEAIDVLGVRLLVFDALIRFHRLQENSATDMAQVAGVCRAFANRGPCVVLNQHLGKPKEGISGGHLVRGSGDIMAMVDLCFGITAGHLTEDHLGQEYHVRYLKPPRFGPPPEPFVYVVHGPSEGPNTVLYKGVEAEDETMRDQGEEAVIDMLTNRGPTRSSKLVDQVIRVTGCKERWAKQCLADLFGAGRVARQGRGIYYLPELHPEMLTDNEGDEG